MANDELYQCRLCSEALLHVDMRHLAADVEQLGYARTSIPAKAKKVKEEKRVKKEEEKKIKGFQNIFWSSCPTPKNRGKKVRRMQKTL